MRSYRTCWGAYQWGCMSVELRKPLIPLAGFSIAILVVGGVLPAHAEDASLDPNETVQTIQDVTPVDAIDGDSVEVTEDSITADAAGLPVSLPNNPADGIVLGTGEDAIGVGLPFAETADPASLPSDPGIAVYNNNNSSSTVPILRSDGGVQITTVIEDASAPHEYEYPITLPGGLALELGIDGDVSATPAGSSIPALYVAAPWAKDANGNAVPTHYEVNGNTITQVVDFTEASSFPIVADPATYVDYTTASVINVSRLGTVSQWQYLNGCTAARGRTCSVSRTYTVTATAQTSLGVSYSVISSSIGVTAGASVAVSASCGVPNGPGSATLYAQAEKTRYQVKTVRRWGVPTVGGGSMREETKVSGTLYAYKPNGRFSCV